MKGNAIGKIFYALVCVLFLASSAPVLADGGQPNEVVQQLVDNLGKTMDARRDELAKNRESLLKAIDDIVLPHFDIDYASILVLGQNARTASPEQRARFAKAMYNSITHRYAEGLLKYTEARVLAAEQILGRHPNVLKEDLRGVGRP